jgi:hypothetical protein
MRQPEPWARRRTDPWRVPTALVRKIMKHRWLGIVGPVPSTLLAAQTGPGPYARIAIFVAPVAVGTAIGRGHQLCGISRQDRGDSSATSHPKACLASPALGLDILLIRGPAFSDFQRGNALSESSSGGRLTRVAAAATQRRTARNLSISAAVSLTTCCRFRSRDCTTSVTFLLPTGSSRSTR